MDFNSGNNITKQYRIIFNCDGNSFYAGGNDIDKCIENTFGPLENSYVDALFWCDGSGGNTARYNSRVLELAGKRFGKTDPAILKMIEEGNDPPLLVIREARKRNLDIFYSLRLNDVHDFFPKYAYTEFPLFKEEHQDWLIGTRTPYGRYSSLNFAISEVRQIKLEIIKEIFENYDFDGLEIDFMRSPPYFVPGEEVKNTHIMTEFLRKIRRYLSLRSNERGRPIKLAVSVNETLEANELDGFDIKTWVNEELIDILVVGKGAMDISIEEFREIIGNNKVLIYPCLYGYPGDYNPHIPVEMARGLAINYWIRGAYGIYLFNWFPYQPEWAYTISLLKEIGDPNKLNFDRIMFPAENARAPGSPPPTEAPHGMMLSHLPMSLECDNVVSVPIFVGEDYNLNPGKKQPKKLELVVTCTDLLDSDSIIVWFNGSLIKENEYRKDNPYINDFNEECSVWERACWNTLVIDKIVFALDLEQVKFGKNLIEVLLDKKNSNDNNTPVLRRAEVYIEY